MLRTVIENAMYSPGPAVAKPATKERVPKRSVKKAAMPAYSTPTAIGAGEYGAVPAPMEEAYLAPVKLNPTYDLSSPEPAEDAYLAPVSLNPTYDLGTGDNAAAVNER